MRAGTDPGEKWCERGDSNSHGLPHWNLNPARLPVPPLSQVQILSRALYSERGEARMSPPEKKTACVKQAV